jgi:hypothetical protein
MIHLTRDEHANHYTTDSVEKIIIMTKNTRQQSIAMFKREIYTYTKNFHLIVWSWVKEWEKHELNDKTIHLFQLWQNWKIWNIINIHIIMLDSDQSSKCPGYFTLSTPPYLWVLFKSVVYLKVV